MKKTLRTLIMMVMAVLLLTAATIPALAAEGFDFESALEDFVSSKLNTYTLEVGEKHAPGASVWAQGGGATCHSSDESVVTVSAGGTVTAVGEGTAYVAIDTGHMYDMYRYDVVAVGAKENGNRSGGFNFGIVIFTLALLLTFAAVIYIFITAPKCGMTRLWALIPIFSSVLGLLVFIVVRTNRKTISGSYGSTKTIVCPTCGGVHPAGTTECSICGTKLQ